MLKNAYSLAKNGADTAENEQQFANILPKFCRSVAGARPAGRRRAMPRRPGSGARRAPRRTTSGVPRTSTHYACSSVALGLRVLKYVLWTVRSQLYRSRFCKQTLILHNILYTIFAHFCICKHSFYIVYNIQYSRTFALI